MCLVLIVLENIMDCRIFFKISVVMVVVVILLRLLFVIFYEKKYVDVLGYKMVYIDEGEGCLVVFLYGNLVLFYFWWNIIFYVVDGYCVIVFDLMGMGDSDKFVMIEMYYESVYYFYIFLDGLDLKDVVLVIYDWGFVFGWYYVWMWFDCIFVVVFMEVMVLFFMFMNDMSVFFIELF